MYTSAYFFLAIARTPKRTALHGLKYGFRELQSGEALARRGERQGKTQKPGGAGGAGGS